MREFSELREEKFLRAQPMNDYIDTMDRVLDAMSLSLGFIPLLDQRNLHLADGDIIPVIHLDPDPRPLRELYTTNSIAKEIILEFCSGDSSLSLEKFGITGEEIE
jgi:hypothetical protein